MLIDALPHGDAVQTAGAAYAGRLEQLIDLCIAVQQIPAPTGAETERARWVENRMRTIGLADVARDELGNVYGRVRGPRPQAHPALLVSAHTDTVFPPETDLRLRRLNNGLIPRARHRRQLDRRCRPAHPGRNVDATCRAAGRHLAGRKLDGRGRRRPARHAPSRRSAG